MTVAARPAVPLPLLEAGLVVGWSSGFVGARLAAETAPVFQVLFWRFAVTALLLAPLLLLRPAWRPTRGQAARHAVLGALSIAGFLGFVVWAVDLGVSAGVTALVAALQPLVTALLAGVALGERLAPRQWGGLALGLGGVALAVGGAVGVGAAPGFAYALPVAGMACLVAATLWAKRAEDCTPVMGALAVQSLVAAAIFAPIGAAQGPLLTAPSAGLLAAVAWFVVLSTLGGYGLYWACLARSSATRVASLIYLTPPVTAIWAWAMFGDPIGPATWTAFAVCALAVWLTRARAEAPPMPKCGL